MSDKKSDQEIIDNNTGVSDSAFASPETMRIRIGQAVQDEEEKAPEAPNGGKRKI